MIYYFSGTGNSQLIAYEIAKQTNYQCQSITPYLKQQKKFQFKIQEPLIIIAPTYAWRLPRIIEKWIENKEFIGCNKVYFILTCGGSVGNASHYLKQLCAKKHWDYQGIASILMPDNYIALYDTPDKNTCDQLIESAVSQVPPISKLIIEGKPFPSLPLTLKGKINSKLVNLLFYSFYVSDSAFQVTSSCINCGKCSKRCPLNNIDIVQEKPIWKHQCTHCMSCIAGCPTNAIIYKKSPYRYHHFMLKDEDNLKIGG